MTTSSPTTSTTTCRGLSTTSPSVTERVVADQVPTSTQYTFHIKQNANMSESIAMSDVGNVKHSLELMRRLFHLAYIGDDDFEPIDNFKDGQPCDKDEGMSNIHRHVDLSGQRRPLS